MNLVCVCLSVSQASAHCCSLWDGKSGTGACSQGSRPQRKGPQWWDTLFPLPVVTVSEIILILSPSHPFTLPRQHSSSVLCSQPACGRVFGVHLTGHAWTEGHYILRHWSSHRTASSLSYIDLVTYTTRRLCYNDSSCWEMGLLNWGQPGPRVPCFV